jgi:1-phosphofructokinase
MVITVTLNPAIDKTIYVDDLVLNGVNRVSKSRTDIGGKGINVSKVLKNLGIDSICTGFLGEKNYFLKELHKNGIETSFIYIDDDIRINTKIIDNVRNLYTDINENGPNISSDDLGRFIDHFSSICHKDDLIVLSGGASSSIPTDIYAVLIKIAKVKGAYTILDAEGELLTEGIKAKPNIIKPNEFEFKKIIRLGGGNRDDMISAAHDFVDYGIDIVMISLGENGAIYVSDKDVFIAKTSSVKVNSTVGAGDAMVAAIVYSILNNFSAENMVRFAVACGTASVSLEGTEACTLEQAKQFLNNKITKINAENCNRQ